jgi:polyisoprenyl-phosphate glycosyltransferase
MSSPFVSVVMAATEAGALPAYLGRLSAALRHRFPEHELVVVDNGSPEEEAARLREAALRTPGVQLFRLARRVDEHAALTAGLDQCIGEVIVVVDALLDPPAAVLAAAETVAGGCEAVYGVDRRRRSRSGPVYGVLARGFAWYYGRATGVPVPVASPGLRAVSRRVLNGWLQNRDRHRLLRVLPALSGGTYAVTHYDGDDAPGRRRPLHRSLRSGLGAILGSTAAPLRLACYLAVTASFLSFAYALYVVLVTTLRGDVVEGWTSLSLVFSGLFFLLSVVLAVLAEYVFQIVQRSHDRALYRIAEETAGAVSAVRAPNVVAIVDADAARVG